MKRSWPFVAGGAAVLAVLFLLSSSGKKPPVIPRDERHASLTTNESCLSCHGPGKNAPLRDTHPPKEQCLICHKAGNR